MALEDRRGYQEACNRCSQCKFVPMPESKAFSSICPSIDYGDFHAYSGGGKVITSYMLRENKAEITSRVVESVYACTMCGACDVACRTNLGDDVEPLDTIYELRAHLAKQGKLPDKLTGMIDALRREGSHLGRREERSRWAKDLGIKDATLERVDVLVHIDGENAFDPAQWPQLRTLIKVLEAADVNFGIAYDHENDSGGLAFDLGYQDEARALAEHQQKILRQSGASVLLAASASAFAAFRGIYPRLDVSLDGVRIVHATEFVADLLDSGKAKYAAAHAIKATYHDPCRLGRLSEPYEKWTGKTITVLNTLIVPDPPRPARFGLNGQYEAPRKLLSAIEGVEVVEMERNREFAFCCGAGAGVSQAYPEMADKAAVSRLQEAQKTGATHLITACAGCERHLTAVAAEHGIELEVCGIFDLLANSISRG